MEGNNKRFVPSWVYVIIVVAIFGAIFNAIFAIEMNSIIQLLIDNLPADTENYQEVVDTLNSMRPYLVGICALFAVLFVVSAVGTYLGNKFFWIYNIVFWIIALVCGITTILGLILGILVVYALFREDVKEYFEA